MAKSSRQCWFAAAAAVQVDVGGQLTAHVSGVHRCGSSWSCPVCAPVVRERRAVEVDAALERHLAAGGSGLFLTLTLRHGRRDRLAVRLEVIAEALRLVLRGNSWDRRRDRLGYLGSIKAVEVTHGENGWHPHAHVALLFERPLTEIETADLEEWIYGRWSKVARDRKLGTVTREHGVDLREITTGEGVGRYVTKVVDGWSAGHELARGDRKSSSPLQLLRSFVETGEVRCRDLWVEYEEATMGKRSLRWSPGLRARLLGVEEEPTDQELAASEGVDLTLYRALIEASDWRRVLQAGATGELLSMVEDGAALLIGLARLAGWEPQPLDVPRGAGPPGTERSGASTGPPDRRTLARP